MPAVGVDVVLGPIHGRHAPLAHLAFSGHLASLRSGASTPPGPDRVRPIRQATRGAPTLLAPGASLCGRKTVFTIGAPQAVDHHGWMLLISL